MITTIHKIAKIIKIVNYKGVGYNYSLRKSIGGIRKLAHHVSQQSFSYLIKTISANNQARSSNLADRYQLPYFMSIIFRVST